MRLSRIIILFACILSFTYEANAQRGKDGDYTVTAANEVLNTYTSLSANATAGNTSISVVNNAMAGGVFTGNLAPGDLLMIVQMYGATIDAFDGGGYSVPGNSISGPFDPWWTILEQWGAVNAPFGYYYDAGKFEQVEVLSVSGGGTINLQCGLKNNYNAAKRVQVIRIPRFENLTVNAAASIVPTLWNGISGGVVALEVNTDLTMNAGSLISADEFGFRGGQVDLTGSSGSNFAPQTRFLGSTNPAEGSEKGESIFGYHAELDAPNIGRYGIGAPANGGGGAGYENAGGGGGSNIYIGGGTYTGNGTPIGYVGAWNQESAGFGGSTSPGGGRGGYAQARNNQDAFLVGPDDTAWGGDARKNNGGRGGHPLVYDPTRLFFGGGGGAGDDNSNQGGAGGRGGGIVYIANYGTTTGTGTISANGQDGQNANPNNFTIGGAIDRIGVDGAGGGGAGGAIFIENAANLPGTITLSSQGGDGGDQNLQYASGFIPREADGPGGSGTGGSIAYNSGAPTQQLNAGANGVSNSISSGNLVAEFPPNGATTGNNGFGSLPAPYFDITAADVVLCAPGVANLTAVILGTLPGGYTVQWYNQQFGGAVLASGLNYSPNVPATTTFYVGTCPGTFRIPVTVTILPGSPNLVITDPAPVCAPSTVDITLPAVTAGSDPGTLTYWTDAGATVSYGTPTTATDGTYYIQLDVGGCITIEAVNVTVNPTPNLVITDPAAVCAPATVDLTAAAVTAGSDAGTLTYWTDAGATISYGTPTAATNGTYYIQLEDGSGCTSIEAVNVTVNPTPNLVITDPAAACAPATVDLTAAAVTAGSDAGTLTYWTDAGATISYGTPTTATNGTYYIQLEDASGCTSIEAVNVTVNPAPNLVITDPAAVCTPATVDLTAAAVTAGSDAGTLTYWTDAGATISYGTPTTATNGTYYIQLEDASGCTSVEAVNVTVNPAPNLVITDPAAVCTPATVDLTAAAVTAGSDAGTLTYWTDAGATISYGTPTTATNGTYYIQLEDASGCTSIEAVNVTVNPTPNLVITDPAAVCAPGTVDLTAAAVTAGSDAGTLTYWTDAGATISYGTPSTATNGTYYIQLEDASGCTSIAAVNVTVNPAPNLVITDPAAVCAPSTVDLTAAAVTAGSDAGTLTYWTDAGATISYATPTTATNGTYYIQLEDGNGCTSIEAVNVVVNPLDDASFTMTPTCDGGTANVTGTPGGNWAFNPAPADLATIDGAGTVANGTTGTTYFVEYTTTGACPASSIESVTASTDLSYGVTLTDENCGAADGIIDLVAANGDGGPYQYSITGGAPYSPSGNFTGLIAGNYNISILDGSGCEITGVESLSSSGGPTIDNITPTNPTCAGGCDGSITVTVSGGTPPYSYQWYDNLGNPVGIDDPTLSNICAGDYDVEVTDAAGGLVFLYQEGFSNGCASNCFATSYGGWNVTNTGPNGSDANDWYVSGAECGNAPGACGSGCGGVDPSLHISAPVIGDAGAVYMAGGLGFWFVETDKRAESPLIDLTGQTGMTLSFNYIEYGDGAIDNGELWYNDGGGWVLWQDLAKCVLGVCAPQGTWTNVTMPMPAWADNNPNVQVGFRWYNNDDNVGTDPSFAIDDIEITVNSSACPAFANATVTDPPALNLVITDPAAVCAPATVDLTAAAVTAGSDAGTLTYWTDAGATISYATPTTATNGTYYIQLEDGSGCTVIEVVNVTVNPAPNLVITDPAAACAPNTVDITLPAVTAGSDAGTLTYWTDAGATIALGTPNAVATSGTYYIQLEDGSGCTSIEAVNVVVTSTPNLVITDPAAVCDPSTVDITVPEVTAGSDPGTLTYWTDAGATISYGTPTVATNGTYYIQLDIGGGCTTVEAVNVTVNPLPNLVITDPAAVCAPGTVDITAAAVTAGSDAGTLTYWTDAGATISYGTPAAATNGTYYIQLEDGNGCMSVEAVNVTVNPAPNLVITDPPAACSPATVDLTAAAVTAGSDAGTLTYWTDAGATIALATPNAVATSGTYYIQLEDGSGCTSIEAVNVVVTSTPNLVITDPAAVCDPSTVDITVPAVTAGSDPGTLTYWTDAGATIGYATPTTATDGTYYIQLDIGGGCTTVEAVNVTVNPLPNLMITDPAAVCAPGTVDLTGAAVTAGSDAGTLTYWTDAGATISYGTPTTATDGTYYIQLEDGNGCMSVEQVNVTVNPAPNLVITDPPAACSPGTVDLTAAAVTAGSDAGTLTYWTDAGATIALGTPNSVATSGTYYIQLEDGNGCMSVEPVDVVVTSTPNLVITDPAGVCDPGTVDITVPAVTAGSDPGTLTYWTDAGATISFGTPTVATNGTYYIQLDIGGGCTTVEPVIVTVNPLPNLVITDPAAVCDPATVDLTAAGVTAGSDAGTLTYWTDAGATISYATPTTATDGTYYIQLEDGNGCMSVEPVNATVNAQPIVTATNDGPACAGGTFNLDETGGAAVGWSWSTGGGAIITTMTDQSPSVTGAADGDVFTVIVTDVNGCTNSANTTVSIAPAPILDPIANVPVCDSYVLPAITGTNLTGGEAYYDDSQANGGTVISGTLTSSQTVWVYDGSGACNDEISFVLTVNPSPTVVSTSGNGIYCTGDVPADILVEVSGTGPWTLDYEIDGVPQTANSATDIFNLGNAPGVYTLVTLTDAFCSDAVSGTLTIVINPTPATPVASEDGTYCLGEFVPSMTVIGSGGTYNWYMDASLNAVIGIGSSFAPSDFIGTTVYYVTETVGSCESAPDSVFITIENCEVIYPSAFTPDGDLSNDTWELPGLDQSYPNNTVRIYNRWGNLIFEHNSSVTNPYNLNQWDGTYKGNKLPVASYYYIIELNNDAQDTEKGTVTIVLNE